MNQEENKLKELIIATIKAYQKSSGFSDRKVTDSPTDSFSVVNRAYVTANGTTALRPATPITGQYYFDATLSRPIWYTGSQWIKADGTVV